VLANRGIAGGFRKNRRRPSQLDDQGRYEIRLLVNNPLARELINVLLEHEGFRAVEEQTLEGNTVIGSIIHEPTESSHLPGRTK
jgi:hypothetical protein